MSIFSSDAARRILRWSFVCTRSLSFNISKHPNGPSFLLLQLLTSSVNKEVRNIWRRRSKHCSWFQFDSNEHWNCIIQWFCKFNLLSIFSWLFLVWVCLRFRRFQRHSSTRLQVEISVKTSIKSTIFVHGWFYTDLDSISTQMISSEFSSAAIISFSFLLSAIADSYFISQSSSEFKRCCFLLCAIPSLFDSF